MVNIIIGSQTINLDTTFQKTYSINNSIKSTQKEFFSNLEKDIDSDFASSGKTKKDISVLYIYRTENNMSTLKGAGTNIAYIGVAEEEWKESSNVYSLGFRFKHCRKATRGDGDDKGNYSLGYLFDNGTKMTLEIYQLASGETDAERKLLNAFREEFAQGPVAQGQTGLCYK